MQFEFFYAVYYNNNKQYNTNYYQIRNYNFIFIVFRVIL